MDHEQRRALTSRVSGRLRQTLPACVGLVLFLLALEVLRLELRSVSWHELRTDVLDVPSWRFALAILLTALNYLTLTGYDLLAFRYIGKTMPRARIALASFLAYGVANNVGFAMLSGASVRYRFYTRWGVDTEDLSRIVFSNSVTFWLGLMVLGGVSLAVAPLPGEPGLPSHRLVVFAGWLLTLIPLAYVAIAALRPKPLRILGLDLPMPSAGLAITQLVISAADWVLAGAVLYVLLPPSALTFLQFIGLFLVAILLGLVSHVPGGVGVFEGLMVLLLKPYLGSGQLLPALVVYRAVYYLLPLTMALIVLVIDEVRQRTGHATRVSAALGRLSEQMIPRLLAVFTFAAGLILLFSGATPSGHGRLAMLNRVLPLGVIEASHFLASVAGAGLIVLSQGLARRLDAAFYLTVGLMLVGIAGSMAKGFDYEEAALLLTLLVVLWRARPAFDRRAAFFETRFSAAWIAAVVGAVGASVWLGLFAFRHVEYGHELWWQFALQGDVSRFLRGSVGAAVTILLFGFARLIGRAPHEAPVPTDADLADAARVIALQTATYPHLAFLRDKALLFNAARTGFVMYGVQGRTWVALGDPVGPDDCLSDLIRLFLERCNDFDGVPVFYEVSRTHLHRYADFGLTFVKAGEEAKVDLRTFTLEGGHAAKHRQVIRYLQRDGGVFRIVFSEDVPGIMGQLRTVSDEWLADKAAGEKGFSLGFFDETYLSRFPVAVIERAGRIQAFANVLSGARHEELSVDLMRYGREAPKGVMEALLVHLLQWGKEQGYAWFALGMAPLSGFEQSPVGSLWNRVGAFLYEHADSVYNFRGLRSYKQKFNPVWEPHYLAYPGGLRLPRILADVSALIAGGYRRIFLK